VGLVADVERVRGPRDVAPGDVLHVQHAAREARGETDRELRVVGDRARREIEWPTADDVGRRCGRERRVRRLIDHLELVGGPERVTDRESQECAARGFS
jgi:hypothetical protein